MKNSSLIKNSKLIFNIEKLETTAIININGFIGDEYDDNDAKTFARALQELKGLDLTIRINSPGGIVTDGFQMHDLLAMHEGKVTTEVYGGTASAATIISQVGIRMMSTNALMLVHHAWGCFCGNVNDMRENIETLAKFDEQILSIYTKRGADKEVITNLMAANNGNGKWINADEALTAGLIDGTFEPTEARSEIDAKLIKNLGLPEIPVKAEVPEKPVKKEESTDVDAEAQNSERRRRQIQIKTKKEK